jgi:hypothetical protein
MKSQKLLVIAAIVCLLVGASGAAYAADCSGGSIIKKIVNQIRCAAMDGCAQRRRRQRLRHELHQLPRRGEDPWRSRQDGDRLQEDPGGTFRRTGGSCALRRNSARRAQHVRHRNVHPHGRRVQHQVRHGRVNGGGVTR